MSHRTQASPAAPADAAATQTPGTPLPVPKRTKPKAAAALAKETESASYPEALEAGGRMLTGLYAGAIHNIDLAIQRINLELHRVQPPKDGKIQVRFYRRRSAGVSVTQGDLVDAVPTAIKWYKIKRDPPLGRTRTNRYVTKKLAWNRVPLAEQRAKGFDFVHNDAATKRLLNELQRLLDVRRRIRASFMRARLDAKRFSAMAERLHTVAATLAAKARPKVDFLVYDDARHIKEIRRARAAEDRLASKPGPPRI